MTTSYPVHCSNCDYSFGPQNDSMDPKAPCPQCGEIKKTVKINLGYDEYNLSENIKENLRILKGPVNKSLKKHFVQEIKTGDDFFHKEQKWVQKERVIDRENDHYLEKIIDPETGEIIHHISGSLREHQDHGSAKSKKQNTEQGGADPSSPPASGND